MGTRTMYGPGTFCWVDLSTTDVDAARSFYAALFGWDYDRVTDEDGFATARRYGAHVAAIDPQKAWERAQRLPARWHNYVSVDDADTAAARAKQLGAAVLTEPFDVSDAGRAAVIIDPTGAELWLWQPRKHIGAGHVNDTGCLTFNELQTADTERAIAFYSALYGWRFERIETTDEAPYWVIRHDAAAQGLGGGMRALREDETPAGAVRPRWMPYFTVASAVSTIDKATGSGGSLVAGPLQAGAGTIAVVSDPTGATFGLFEGQVDD